MGYKTARWWGEALLVVMVLAFVASEVLDIVTWLRLRRRFQLAHALLLDKTVHLKAPASYFDDVWNVFDLLNYVLFIAMFAIELTARMRLDEVVREVNSRLGLAAHTNTPWPFICLFEPVLWSTFAYQLSAVNAVITWLKVLKYVLRVLPPRARVPRVQGSSGAVATVQFCMARPR